jgi:hypothetical protein
MLPAFASCCDDLVWLRAAALAVVRGGRLAGDAEADGGRHLPRRVRQQLPRGQEQQVKLAMLVATRYTSRATCEFFSPFACLSMSTTANQFGKWRLVPFV